MTPIIESLKKPFRRKKEESAVPALGTIERLRYFRAMRTQVENAIEEAREAWNKANKASG